MHCRPSLKISLPHDGLPAIPRKGFPGKSSHRSTPHTCPSLCRGPVLAVWKHILTKWPSLVLALPVPLEGQSRGTWSKHSISWWAAAPSSVLHPFCKPLSLHDHANPAELSSPQWLRTAARWAEERKHGTFLGMQPKHRRGNKRLFTGEQQRMVILGGEGQ